MNVCSTVNELYANIAKLVNFIANFSIKFYNFGMEKELRDLYDVNLQKTDKTYYKGDPIPEGYHPMVVVILIENSKGEYLMQKRSQEKGGYWAVTGGHPKSGETPEQGMVTEVKEEIGVDISNDKLTIFDKGCDGKDCFIFYYVKKDVDISTCVVQEEEVQEVAWISSEEIKRRYEVGELTPDQAAFFRRYYRFLENKKKA